MNKINIKTSNSTYSVLIGNSILSKLPRQLDQLETHKNLFIIVDKNVYKNHKKNIKSTFSKLGDKKHYYILQSGEKTKSETELRKIYNSLLENKFGRDTAILAIGGGVTGDIAGYAAATYMRGIQLVHVPTTLIAMIDSSIGGKSGINFANRKNIIGAFYHPKLVFIDVEFLKSLPLREFDSAMGELIKYALISGEHFYKFLFKNIEKIKSKENRVIIKIISESVKIKAAVVSQDEFDNKGIRIVLNLGHTFAHAIESDFGFKIKHGEAVFIGLICSFYLSHSLGLLNDKELKSLLHFSCSWKLPSVAKNINNSSILRAMSNDKKNIDEKIMFVLLSKPGKVLVNVPADLQIVKWVMTEAKNNWFI